MLRSTRLARLRPAARASARTRTGLVFPRLQTTQAGGAPAADDDAQRGSTAGDGSSPKKKSGVGTQIVDWIVDHPTLFFGSLFGALVGYIVHGSVGGNRREAAVSELERAAPISSREISDVGRVNSVKRADFEAVADAAFDRCPAGVASPAELSLLLRRRLLESTGSLPSHGQHPLMLPGEHHLRRAAAVLAAGAVDVPAADAALASSPALSAAAAQGSAPAPLLQLLSLYGTLVGGRPEHAHAPPSSAAPAPQEGGGSSAADADSDPPPLYPSPSERVAMWLAWVRRAARVYQGAAWAQASSFSTPVVGAGAASPPAALAPVPLPPPPPPRPPSPAPPGMVSESELEVLVGLLGATWQLPPRARVHQVATYPFPAFARRTPRQHVEEGLREMRIDEERAKAAETLAAQVQAAAGGGGGGHSGGSSSSHAAAPVDAGTFVDPGTLSRCPSHLPPTGTGTGSASGPGERLFSLHEAHKLLLRSKAICAWNECHERHG